jgi:hypothetical protein
MKAARPAVFLLVLPLAWAFWPYLYAPILRGLFG